MRTSRAICGIVILTLLTGCGGVPTRRWPRLPPAQSAERCPLVIAHRGASGYAPEHTALAYELAAQQGADYLEPDLVFSRDGVLVVRHENEISKTTDVATRFPERRTRKLVDGELVDGWFAEDFTLAELRTLRARERLEFRSHALDGQLGVLTLREAIDLAGELSRRHGRQVGLYLEMKHPTYFRQLGFDPAGALIAALAEAGLDRELDRVWLQCFEPGFLLQLHAATRYRLVQLLAREGAPYDLVAAGDGRSYAALAAAEGLRFVAQYAQAVGVAKELIRPRDAAGRLLPPTDLIARARQAGLQVHVWTLRREPTFLPGEYGGDLGQELLDFYAGGVDGVFTDFPDAAVAVREQLAGGRCPRP